MARVPRFYLIVVGFLASSLSGLAGTLSMGVSCFPPISTSLGRVVGVSPPFSEELSSLDCFASASASADQADTIRVSASAADASADVSYRSLVQVTFQGGVGDGSYVPCLGTEWSITGDSVAKFGSLTFNSRFGGTCSFAVGGPPPDRIPFTFGVPQLQVLSLSASAVGYFHDASSYGSGDASFNGFRVLDIMGRTEIPGVTWTVAEIPEPRMFGPMLAVLAIAWASRRLSKKRRSETSRIASANSAQLSC